MVTVIFGYVFTKAAASLDLANAHCSVTADKA